MNEASRHLLDRAADCYERVGHVAEAARCYRDAGSYRRAAVLHARLGLYREAAADYVQAGQRDLAAWLLVHETNDPSAARITLSRQPTLDDDGRAAVRPLRQRVVLARCEVAEGASDRGALAVLADVCAALARGEPRHDTYVEPWAVSLAHVIRREDQVALVFAAAVRGHRPGAARRWATWSREVLHTELTLPPEYLTAIAAPSRGAS